MAELFVDTSAWYPLVVGSHPDHDAVASALREELAAGTRLVTSNLVVMETYALLLHRAGRQVAMTFVQTVAQPPTVIITSTPELEEVALTAWLVRYQDQDFSLADGVSFAVMTSRRIRRALALDHHYVTAGFDALPKAGTARRR